VISENARNIEILAVMRLASAIELNPHCDWIEVTDMIGNEFQEIESAAPTNERIH
jgi:hypothetical protein